MMFRELLQKTRSYRSYDGSVPVKKEDLLEIVDTVRCASTSGNNQQLKYRLVYEPQEVEGMISQVRWAGRLSMKLPPEGKEPTAFIVICQDLSLAPQVQPFHYMDVGIAAEVILLKATEMGFGGCMFGTFQEDNLSSFLHLPSEMKPLLVLSLGKPAERVVLKDINQGDSIAYYREADGTHVVPKRSCDSLLIE